VASHSLKCLVEPLLKLTLEFAKYISKSNEERNYQSVRIRSMVIFMGYNIFGIENFKRNNNISKLIEQSIE
jgi:hypothetical protein